MIKFFQKNIPSDGTNKLFVGCMLIMVSRANGFEVRSNYNR